MRLLVVCLVLFLVDCAPKSGQNSALSAPFSTLKWTDLVGQPFELSALRAGGKTVTLPASRRPTMLFSDANRVSGMAGVNRYSAEATVSGKDSITWTSPPVGTRMAGPAEAMALEESFLEAMQASTKIELTGGTLRLSSADGAATLELKR